MKAQYEIFVKEMVKHGDENKSVIKAYPHLKGNKKQIRNYCGRLMKNDEVSKAIHQQSSKIKEAATNKAIEELKDEIKVEMLDATQKRNLLFKIATSVHEVEEILGYKESAPDKEGNTTFKIIRARRKPTPYEIAKAIELDSKMAGDFAPDKIKVDHTTKGKSLNLSQMPVELRKQILASIRNHT